MKGSIIDPTNVMTPAWVVCAWPPVLWQASAAPQLHLIHLGTRVLNFGDRVCPSSGQTVWGDSSSSHSAGVAWDWVQLRQGVLAIADPFGMVTNLTLLDSNGAALTPQAAAVHLNEIVHALPWQSEVQRALERPNS